MRSGPRAAPWRVGRAALLAVLGSALLTLSAKVQVPFYPVPMTMQTLVVLLIGIGFGFRLGVATVLLYLAEGAVGLPVFAGTPGEGDRARLHAGADRRLSGGLCRSPRRLPAGSPSATAIRGRSRSR